ncbi:cytochrome c551 [Bacillus sp. J37]|uniref:cytochrome c551 n=1 Tax=Bacillus sp. J37 TaxID=935837 RepID=UPI00047AFF9E|nr:cytochrome c [Bacillus sp. J37]
MKTKLMALLFGTVLVLSACGGAEEPAEETTEGGGTTTETAGNAEEIVQKSCIGCHGRDLEGGSGPNLQEVGAKYSEDEIKSIIINGQGGMPKGLLNDADAEVVASWLAEKK